MRFIKLVIISLIVLATLITGLSALFPSTVIVSRAMEVSALPSQIEKYTSNLKEWKYWMSDLKQNKVVWVGDTVKISTQSINLVSKNENSATFNWVAAGQRPYIVKIEWIPLQKGIYVIHWSFEQHVKWYPWEKFQTLLNEKVLGYKMESELANLRDLLLQDKDGNVLLINSPGHLNLVQAIKTRICTNIPEVAERVLFINWMSGEKYYHAINAMDVVLEPFTFGGGNTSYEVFAIGTPIVTKPDKFLRTRFTYALYKLMGIEEPIATSQQDYIDKAIKIASDKAYRQSLKEQILELLN